MKKFLLLILTLSAIQGYTLFGLESDNANNNQELNVDTKTEKTKKIEAIIAIAMNSTGHILDNLPNITNQILGSFKNLEINEDIKNAQKEFCNSILNSMKSQDIISKLTKLYDDIYTEDEIDALLKFYQSSAGKKFIETMPEVALKSSEIFAGIMQEHINIFADKVTKLQANANK